MPTEGPLTIAVRGMTCGSCEEHVETALRAVPGIRSARASAQRGEVRIELEAGVDNLDAAHAAIRKAGYEVDPRGPRAPARGRVYRLLGLAAIVAALAIHARATFGLELLPSVTQDMGYGLIFVVGLLSSLHCVGMCGGIVLSQSVRRTATVEGPSPRHDSASGRLLPSLAYNAGRVVSYTAIGAVVGGLGSLVQLSGTLKGVVPVIAGVFMLFLGIRMLDLFPGLWKLRLRIPGLRLGVFRMAASRRGPFVVGLLNGFMPCGPLQTMQVYALGTGSAFAGALSMFLFSAGTVPLLLGFGVVSSLLSASLNRRMAKASGVLVMALGVVMFTRGLNLFGITLPTAPMRGAASVAVLAQGHQAVRSTISGGDYHPIVVQAGVPVRWTISAKADDLNGCNNPLTVPAFGITKELVPGDNLIEFTPTREGTITYTCWMGMISSTIRVVSDLRAPAEAIAAGGPRVDPVAGSTRCSCCAPSE